MLSAILGFAISCPFVWSRFIISSTKASKSLSCELCFESKISSKPANSNLQFVLFSILINLSITFISSADSILPRIVIRP